MKCAVFLVLFVPILSASPIEDSNSVEEPPKDQSYYRLPKTTIPLHYNIAIDADPDETSFSGHTTILIRAVEDTDSIVLHANGLQISNLFLKTLTGSVLETTSSTSDDDRQFLTIKLKHQILISPLLYELDIEYTANYTVGLEGFYKSSYKNDNGTERYHVLSHFEPTYARTAFPCYDEPALKANFNINIYHPNGYNAISNMDEITSHLPSKENRLLTSFRTSPPISTYLVAFIILDFGYKSNINENNMIYKKEYKIYAKPKAMGMLDDILDFGQKSLLMMEQYIGVKYRLPKADNVAIPKFIDGAMENWGLIMFKENYLYLQKGVTVTEEYLKGLLYMAHENSHFWFGNEVTPSWWDHVWLSEGFGNFFQYYITDQVFNKEWKLMDFYVVDNVHRALQDDADNDSIPMTNKVGSPSEIKRNFGYSSYTKAGCVIRMMQHVLGESLFKQALSSYIKSLPTGVAKPENLYKEMQDVIQSTRINISEIFATWSNSAGYPILNIKSCNCDTIQITQERFYFNKTVHTEEKWWVPFTWTTSCDSNFNVTKLIFIPPNTPENYLKIGWNSWYIANLQQVGYYRVMYDDENWKNLINVLNTENHATFHPSNKAQLIDDSYIFVKTRRFPSYNITLGIINYLQRETEYIPWKAAKQVFKDMNSIMKFSKNYDLYKKFVRSVISRVYNSIEFKPRENDNPITRMKRSLILKIACSHDSSPCLENAEKMLRSDISNRTKVDVDLEYFSYCFGIKNGPKELWNSVLKEYENTNEPHKKLRLIRSLACSNDDEIIDEYLHMTVDPNSRIREKDKLKVVTNVIEKSLPDRIPAIIKFLSDKVTQDTFQQMDDIFYALGFKIMTEEDLYAYNKMIVNFSRNITEDELVEFQYTASNFEGLSKRNFEYMEQIGAWLIEKYHPSLNTKNDHHFIKKKNNFQKKI